MRIELGAWLGLVLLGQALGAPVAPKLAVIAGTDAPELERFAANQLCVYLQRLFGSEVKPTTAVPEPATSLFFIGTPESNPALRRALGSLPFPRLSDQGILLRRWRYGGRPAMIAAGGSPRATLWAVYELAERWGVRYLLHGDILPPRAAFDMPNADAVMEPLLRVRQWRVMNEHAVSQISWGMADYRGLIDQLAKLKFNRLLLQIWQTQPFLTYEEGGIRAHSGTLFFGQRYLLAAGMIGRLLFGEAKEFWNPDLPLPGNYEALRTAAEQHLRNLIDYAHSRGMECVMSATPTEFPPEFAPLLKNPKLYSYQNTKVVMPGAGARVEDAGLTALASAVLRTTVNTYPGIDYLSLDVTEFREWVDQYRDAWRALDAKYGIEKFRPLDEVVRAASERPGYPGGSERAVQEVKGDIVALQFYDRLLTDRKVLRDTRRPDVKFIFSSLAEELFPVLPRILPKGSETLNFVDYTPSRVLRRRKVLERIPSRENPAILIYTLHDDNVGLLPQLATGSLYELTKDLLRLGWAGFSTRLWLLGDHDPCAAYLSKAGWDPHAAPEPVYRDQLRAACGPGCVEDMLTAYRELEAVTVGLEWHGLGLTFFTPPMMMKHWRPEAMAAELVEDRRGYQRALDAVRRARLRSGAGEAGYLDYWVGRLEFGILYLDTVEAVRRAAIADSAGRRGEAVQYAETAVATTVRAIESYAGVVKDRSDRAAIVLLNAYVYQPLRAKVAELKQPVLR